MHPARTATRRAHSDGVRRLGHIPALDGLRGTAVALVVLYHFPTSRWFPGGWVGVDIFFVLSGFLITSLLVEEWSDRGRISFRRFYYRRALRLLPAVVAFLAVWTIVFTVVGTRSLWFWTVPGPSGDGAVIPHDAASLVMSGLASAALYVTNWVPALGGPLPPMGHLWSLAIEEQFYLLWPPIVAIVLAWRGSRGLRQVAMALGFASAAWGVVLWLAGAAPARLHFGTDVRVVGILLGAAAAAMFAQDELGRIAQARVRPLLAGVGALAIAWLTLRVGEGDTVIGVIYAPVALAALAVIVFAVEHPGAAATRLLAQRPLRWLGQRSYALYLWHYPLATWTRGSGWPGAVVGIAASLALAEASWRLVERPAQRHRPQTPG